MIDNYYIDETNTLHTYIGKEKYIVFENITTDEQAKEIIDGLNGGDSKSFKEFESHFIR
jgi:hypothetical protein